MQVEFGGDKRMIGNYPNIMYSCLKFSKNDKLLKKDNGLKRNRILLNYFTFQVIKKLQKKARVSIEKNNKEET